MSFWLIGAGSMARDYAFVLQGLHQTFEVVGRSAGSAEKFEAETGLPVKLGGVESALVGSKVPEQAIVAVGVEHLAEVASELIKAGTRQILIEKPGGLNTGQIQELHQTAVKHKACVYVAYNRRFFSSTALVRELISKDGGATSCIFEFTEWSHVIAPLIKSPGVKEAWFLANSTHVADLAFHLCGYPKDWVAWQEGSLDWHPAAARFCGSGVTDLGILFNYHADWEAPGRWGVEVLTRKHRLILRPMERLQMIEKGTVEVKNLELDDELDRKFKPGLYRQVEAFLSRDYNYFCTLDEQLQHAMFYDKMAGYGQSKSVGT
jgi:predicted dehydrogenase